MESCHSSNICHQPPRNDYRCGESNTIISRAGNPPSTNLPASNLEHHPSPTSSVLSSSHREPTTHLPLHPTTVPFHPSTVGQNIRKKILEFGNTRSSVHSFARTAHSFACSTLITSLAHSAALTRLLTSLIPELVGQ